MANNPPGGGYPPGGYPPGGGPFGAPPGQQPQYGPPGAPAPGGFGPQPPAQPGYGPPGAQPDFSPQGGPAQPGFGAPPGQPGFGPQPGQGGYGPPPGQAGHGAPPDQAGFGQPPGQPGFGQPPGQPGFGQPPGQPGFGQPPGQPGFGQPPGQPGFGQPGGPQPGFGGGALAGAVLGGSKVRGFGKLKIIAGAVVTVLGIIVVGGALWWFHTHPSMYIVNVTGKDGVTVSMDGEKIAENLKNSPTESIAKVKITSVSSGPHKFEAKDSTGKVLESFTIEIKSGSNGYVYAPARNPKICFIVQTDEYKTNPAAPETVKEPFKKLDTTKTIWDVPESIDYWFQDSPTNITIKQKKGSSSSNVVKRALRQAPCDDPNFNP